MLVVTGLFLGELDRNFCPECVEVTLRGSLASGGGLMSGATKSGLNLWCCKLFGSRGKKILVAKQKFRWGIVT